MAAKNTQELNISELKVGMCVIKLDISWFESPFFTHTRVIKDKHDIQALKEAGVKRLKIDLDRSQIQEDPPASESQDEQTEASVESEAEEIATKEEIETIADTVESTLEEELLVASEIRSQLTRKVEDLHEDIDQGRQIDPEPLAPLIDDTVSSLARNNQALMSLVHLSRKSKKIADHAFGSFCLVLNLAMKLDVPAEEREQLGMAALLHDVGWTQLPLNLMGKRKPYSDVEKQLVQKHVGIGAKLLTQSELPPLTLRLVQEHHERSDGSGYPKGVAAEQLHPLSHLLIAVEAYEETIHQLTDQPGQVPTVALRGLYKEAEQGRFDTKVVAAFISSLGIYPPMTVVLLNTGEKARVLEVHTLTPLQPTVRVFYDDMGQPLASPMDIDLREQDSLAQPRQIKRALDPSNPGVDPLGCLVAAA